MAQTSAIPIYTSRGDVAAFAVFPYLFNTQGEWIGWLTSERDVYSVLGRYVGYMTDEPRILRRELIAAQKTSRPTPPPPAQFRPLATVPLAPLMKELYPGIIDVLLEESDLLHTVDSGELRQDLD